MARSCKLWLREDDADWKTPGKETFFCAADRAGEELSDWGAAAEAVGFSAELRGCGNVSEAELEAVETGGVEKTSPEKLEAEAAGVLLLGLNEAFTVERTSWKSDGVESAWIVGKLVSKRPKSWLESWNVL